MRERYKHPDNFEIMKKAAEILDDEGNSAAKEYVCAVLSACYARGLCSQGSPFKETILKLSEKYGYEPSRHL